MRVGRNGRGEAVVRERATPTRNRDRNDFILEEEGMAGQRNVESEGHSEVL